MSVFRISDGNFGDDGLISSTVVHEAETVEAAWEWLIEQATSDNYWVRDAAFGYILDEYEGDKRIGMPSIRDDYRILKRWEAAWEAHKLTKPPTFEETMAKINANGGILACRVN